MILVNVLLIVALASGVVALMLSTQDGGLQRALRLREAARADAAIRGGELSAVAALRRDAATAPASDDLSEPWARIGDRAVAIEGGRFSLAIADAQARFNVNALAEPNVANVGTLRSIVAAARLPDDIATRIAALLRATGPIADLGQLRLAGLDTSAIVTLARTLTVLPPGTKVNVNTADQALLGILVGNEVAGRLLASQRDRQGFLRPDDFARAHTLMPPGAGFTSNLFWVRTRVTIGDTSREQVSLLRRAGGGERVIVRAIGRWNGAAAPAQAPPLP